MFHGFGAQGYTPIGFIFKVFFKNIHFYIPFNLDPWQKDPFVIAGFLEY